MSQEIISLTQFIETIESLQASKTGSLFFRGHTKASHELIPSVFRSQRHRHFEREQLFELISESPSEFLSDNLFFDKLVRAQHYGVPTRLLDVTTNPLMALYFACERNFEDHGHFVVVEAPQNSIKFFPSDTVSCKANLAQLNDHERETIPKLIDRSLSEIYGPDRQSMSLSKRRSHNPGKYEKFIESFNDSETMRRLVQFIKEEKPYFENRIDPIDILSIEAVLPKKSNARISAQSGAFLLFGLIAEFSARSAKDITVSQIKVRSDKKKNIITSLEAIGIHENAVYPELDRIGSRINKKYSEL